MSGQDETICSYEIDVFDEVGSQRIVVSSGSLSCLFCSKEPSHPIICGE